MGRRGLDCLSTLIARKTADTMGRTKGITNKSRVYYKNRALNTWGIELPRSVALAN